jgi:hypothetical protein
MAAVTAIVAVAGLGITAYSMIDQNNKAKEAEKQMKADRQALASIKEVNPYAALQAPDVSSLANQQIAQSTKEGVKAAQDAGEAGAAQITGMVQAGREAALGAAQDQAQANYSRDLAVATGEADINKRKALREEAILTESAQRNEDAMNTAKANVNAGVGDLFTGVGNVAKEVGAATSLENKAQRVNKENGLASNNLTKEQSTWWDKYQLMNENLTKF